MQTWIIVIIGYLIRPNREKDLFLYEFHTNFIKAVLDFCLFFLLILIFFNYEKKEIFKQYSNTALN